VRSTSPGKLRLDDVLFDLDDKGQHILIESGPTLAQSFFEQNQCDRVWIIKSPKSIDDPTAPDALPIPPDYVKTAEVNLDGDILVEYLNPHSPVYFSSEASADIARLM
jgi:riboflavin biosynthesis pyrimidine reductase